MTSAIGIALTGLNSASTKLNASASNIANFGNVGSLTDSDNAPYTPLTTQSKSDNLGGVQTTTVPRNNPFTPTFDGDSPFADENGIIGVPNVDFAEEIITIKHAELAYKANLKTIETAGQMFDELLDSLNRNK